MMKLWIICGILVLKAGKIMDFKINYKVKQFNNMLCEIDSVYQKLLSTKNISDSEYSIIFAILSLGEGCLQKDISTISHISKKTVNSTIKKFEREELIRLKAGKYPNMHIYLSPNGKKYIKEDVLPILEAENNFMESIPDDEFDLFLELYSKYIQKFKEQINPSK